MTVQLKELQELDVKQTAEITALKDDMSGMQSLIDQKSAEVYIYNIFLNDLFSEIRIKILYIYIILIRIIILGGF